MDSLCPYLHVRALVSSLFDRPALISSTCALWQAHANVSPPYAFYCLLYRLLLEDSPVSIKIRPTPIRRSGIFA